MVNIEDRIAKLPKWARHHINSLEQTSRIGTIPVVIRTPENGLVSSNVFALPREGEIWRFVHGDIKIAGRVAAIQHSDSDGKVSIIIRLQNL